MAFLDNKIRITDIITIVETLLAAHTPIKNASLEQIIALDEETRTQAQKMIKELLINI